MKILFVFVTLFVCIFALEIQLVQDPTTYSVKFVGSPASQAKYTTCEIIKIGEAPNTHRAVNDGSDEKSTKVYVDRFPQFISHDNIKIETDIVEVFGLNRDAVMTELNEICRAMIDAPKSNPEDSAADELETILLSGPVNNRIGVVYMGDGYTNAEKKKHHDDMTRLHTDMFREQTFRSYLPLFNVWSVFRASQESGVGTHGRAKNTAYKLYRHGTELRGLFPGAPGAIRDACRRAPICTFPTVIGNDDYYGGLGGEFVISTRSPTTGTVVLRHEQGHNYGRIGEEYDGGQVYSGANFASSVATAQTKWSKWLSAPAKAQDSENNINAYVWKDMAPGPVVIPFKSNGKYKRWMLRFSVSGCPEQDSMEVTLDGVKLNWKSKGLLDRSFYEFTSDVPFASGNHNLTFRQLTRPNGPMRQVCNVGLNSYMQEGEFHVSNKYINAYPLYSPGQSRRGFRSQNEECLMRNMTSVNFCKVCEENLWLQFFSRMNCIDSVKLENEGSQVSVSAVMVKIGQFREGGSIHNEKYQIKWSKGGRHDAALDNQFTWKRDSASARGAWTVEAKYTSDEIRMDPSNYSTFKRSFNIQ